MWCENEFDAGILYKKNNSFYVQTPIESMPIEEFNPTTIYDDNDNIIYSSKTLINKPTTNEIIDDNGLVLIEEKIV